MRFLIISIGLLLLTDAVNAPEGFDGRSTEGFDGRSTDGFDGLWFTDGFLSDGRISGFGLLSDGRISGFGLFS